MALLMSLSIYSQDTLNILTSAQCESCKNRLESRMNKFKGVISSNLHIESKVFTVVIDTSLTNLNLVVQKVNDIGYDANGKQATKSAYKRLPECCRKEYKGTH